MKRWISLLLAVFLTALSALAETYETALPEYRYTGDDLYTAVVCEWLKENQADSYTEGDVMIPCPVIVEVDDSNPEDILVWGAFDLYWYELRNTTLFCVSGGSVPGLMHLQQKDGNCTVAAFEAVRDGSDYGEDVQRIFGMRGGLIEKFESDYAGRDEIRLRFISDYVNENMLKITQMQDYGWPPAPLINAPETAEEDQIVQHSSVLGYSIDYDLRLFSFHRFDESTDGLSGVGDLEGISILIQRYDQTIEDVLAQLKEEMEQPVREAAVLGGEAAVLLQDTALPEGVQKKHYLIELEDGCIVISTGNTCYASEDAPVVDGADAAIEQALATFEIN